MVLDGGQRQALDSAYPSPRLASGAGTVLVLATVATSQPEIPSSDPCNTVTLSTNLTVIKIVKISKQPQKVVIIIRKIFF